MSVTSQNKQARPSRGAMLWLGPCHTELGRELRSPCSFCADRCWAPVAAPLEEDFPEGTGNPRAPPRGREDICLCGRDLFEAHAAFILSPFHSLSLSLPLFGLLPPFPPTPYPLLSPSFSLLNFSRRKQKGGTEQRIEDHLTSQGRRSLL